MVDTKVISSRAPRMHELAGKLRGGSCSCAHQSVLTKNEEESTVFVCRYLDPCMRWIFASGSLQLHWPTNRMQMQRPWRWHWHKQGLWLPVRFREGQTNSALCANWLDILSKTVGTTSPTTQMVIILRNTRICFLHVHHLSSVGLLTQY